MNENEVFAKLQDICRDIFENENLVITKDMSSDDVENWDSLTHLTLINELETVYKIEFTLDEVSESMTIGALFDILMRHLDNA